MYIAIVGGGAAGLFAAAVLKQNNVPFTLFEREARVGKKLLATGNGRCNLTNANVVLSRYHGDTDFAAYALENFNAFSVMDFLAELGILCVYEGDKVFPMSLSAAAVLDLFRLYVGDAQTETEVLSVVPQNKKYLLKTTKGEQVFDKVIFACGGKAAKKLSGGGSYNLLTDLGYTLTALKPAIVQLKCEGTKALEGIKVVANVTLDNQTESGEVLFTSYGLSGPPILQISRNAKGKTVKLDLLPDYNFKQVADMLAERKKLSHLTLENFFTGILNKKVGQYVLKKAGISPLSRMVDSVTDREIKAIANAVKCLTFNITDTNGFDNAQVTAGGISCKDFDAQTMESLKHKGLYVVGEMLNVDGDCGGFNLQWAFSSAYAAATHAGGGV